MLLSVHIREWGQSDITLTFDKFQEQTGLNYAGFFFNVCELPRKTQFWHIRPWFYTYNHAQSSCFMSQQPWNHESSLVTPWSPMNTCIMHITPDGTQKSASKMFSLLLFGHKHLTVLFYFVDLRKDCCRKIAVGGDFKRPRWVVGVNKQFICVSRELGEPLLLWYIAPCNSLTWYYGVFMTYIETAGWLVVGA